MRWMLFDFLFFYKDLPNTKNVQENSHFATNSFRLQKLGVY